MWGRIRELGLLVGGSEVGTAIMRVCSSVLAYLTGREFTLVLLSVVEWVGTVAGLGLG